MIALLWAANAWPDATSIERPAFLVFDGLLYQGKPDLSKLGMLPIRGVNPPVVGDHSALAVNADDVRFTLSDLLGYQSVVYLDYEQWAIFPAPDTVLADSIDKLSQVAQIARHALPSAQFGFYGIPPCFDYWDLVKNDAEAIESWNQCNRSLDAIAQQIDVIFPSIYTFYNDPQGWDIYAAAALQAAKRYHKPVYAFLWPEFHVSNRVLRGKNLPGNFWRHELEFCKTRADGIVIWGGWHEQWDDQAPWWLETKSFLSSLGH